MISKYPEGAGQRTIAATYVADTANGSVRQVDIASRVTSTAKKGFHLPNSVAADDSGNVFVAEAQAIWRIDGVNPKGVLDEADATRTENLT